MDDPRDRHVDAMLELIDALDGILNAEIEFPRRSAGRGLGKAWPAEVFFYTKKDRTQFAAKFEAWKRARLDLWDWRDAMEKDKEPPLAR